MVEHSPAILASEEKSYHHMYIAVDRVDVVMLTRNFDFTFSI